MPLMQYRGDDEAVNLVSVRRRERRLRLRGLVDFAWRFRRRWLRSRALGRRYRATSAREVSGRGLFLVTVLAMAVKLFVDLRAE